MFYGSIELVQAIMSERQRTSSVATLKGSRRPQPILWLVAVCTAAIVLIACGSPSR